MLLRGYVYAFKNLLVHWYSWLEDWFSAFKEQLVH